MQKIIILIGCCCFTLFSWSQTNITKAEYFFNTDPGFGNGINIPITPAADLSNINFPANLAPLSLGLNSLFIRSRDANGKWSVTNRFLFVKTSAFSSTNINKAEYFIDVDPGFGNGTNVPVTPSTDIANTAFNVNLTGVSEGLHSLYIRSRNEDGRWGVSNRFLFVRSFSAVQNVTLAEYFFDNDPGFGNATPITLTPGSDLPRR